MGTSKRAGIDFYVKVDTNRDLFGQAAGFKAIHVNDNTGTTTDIEGSFSEVVQTVGAGSSTLSADVLEGAKTITVADAGDFSVGDTIQIAAGEMHYIESIDETDLNLKAKLESGHAANDAVDLVGNTGVYRLPANIANPGDYTIIVSNPALNMQNVAFPVEVVDENIIDANEKLNILLDEFDANTLEVRYKAFV